VADGYRRFLFEHTPLRGGWAHLDTTYREVLSRHDYPPLLRRFLGEMLAATALLGINLKFNGSMVVQLQSSGPLTLLVVECAGGEALRAIAKWTGELPADSGEVDLMTLAPDGRCVITLDPKDGGEMYQGIVALEHGTIATVLEHYMQSSEQLATRLWLAADGQRAAGLMLQKLPGSDRSQGNDGGEDSDQSTEDWNRTTLLASTLKDDELLSLEAQPLLNRLFPEEEVRLFSEHPVRFECGCSEARVARALLLLGRNEVEQVLDEQDGRIEASCEFCNRKYVFDRAGALALFAPEAPAPTVH
jgi:molecular chaperone Hsp33